MDVPNSKLKELVSRIKQLPADQQREFAGLLEEYQKAEGRDLCRNNFMPFVEKMWPGFIGGRHHKIMAEKFEAIAEGTLKRLIICMPPRHSKSEMGSFLFPAWFLGKYPGKKIIQASHTAELAVGFGRKVRNLVDTDAYKEVFPELELRADSKAAGRWDTSNGGSYFAIGIGGAVTGKGADCVYFSCKVLTRRGIVPLSKVRVGDEVYGYDHERQRDGWSRVHAGSTQRKPELVRVGGVLCTPEHRIFTSSGYKQAQHATDFAVRDLRKQVPEKAQGPSECDSQMGRGTAPNTGLLFRKMQSCEKARTNMRLRERKVSSSGDMQGMLSEGKACSSGVFKLQKNIHQTCFGTQKRLRAAWGRLSVFLLKGMLLVTSGKRADKDSGKYREMSDMQSRNSGRKEVLFDEVLLREEGQEHGLHREMVNEEASDKAQGQRSLCVLREGKASDSRSSHRPQRTEQRHDKSHNAVRAVPCPIPYTDIGSCAEDYHGLLQGKGQWVVDIQTETHNFFVAGQEVSSEQEFFEKAILAHNCLIIDDPHDEQEGQSGDPAVFDHAYEWYTSGPRQRLQPGGSIIIICTRWSRRDLVGQVLKASAARKGTDEWEVIEFPAIMPSGKPLWPEFWPLEELEAIKAEIPVHKWEAQYQQNPSSEGAALVKREWWRIWEHDNPPQCNYFIQSWDTAFLKKERADYSACTTWGVFYHPDENGNEQANIILMDAFRDKLEFPSLKKTALEMYQYWQPDNVLIEAKAAGLPLIFELRAMGIPVNEYTPSRGNDKIARVNAIADMFSSGRIWVPQTRFAEEVMEEFASFPAGEHDDYVDSSTQALMRYRRGGFVSLQNDAMDEPIYQRRKVEYY